MGDKLWGEPRKALSHAVASHSCSMIDLAPLGSWYFGLLATSITQHTDFTPFCTTKYQPLIYSMPYYALVLETRVQCSKNRKLLR